MLLALTKRSSLFISLLLLAGGSFLYLAFAVTNLATQPLLNAVLLIVTAATTVFMLLLLINYRSASASLVAQEHSSSDLQPVLPPLSDLSMLSRMQYAVDQHSIVSKTDVAGRIIYVNDLFEEVSGFRRNELIGQTHRLIKSDKHSEDFFLDMWKTITEGKIWHGEVCNQRKNGSYYWVESTIVPFVDNSGKPFEYISVRTEISTIKNYEQALVHAKNEAAEARKVKSKFMSNISHELRTPLNAILGFTQILEMEESIDSKNKTYLHEIGKAGKYLVTLFDNLLDLGCVENGSLSLSLDRVCLYDILHECVNLANMMAREQGISLLVEIEECHDVDIVVDRIRLKQVVLNLLTNAIKYNSVDGSMILKCNQPTAHQSLEIDIIDTGIGMTAEDTLKIFQPFVRVGKNQKCIRGAGVGLALSKSIMQEMGGDILVHSILGQGSRFRITLSDAEIDQATKRQLMY